VYFLSGAGLIACKDVGLFEAWKRNKKVAVHPCREYLSVHDTSKGGTVALRGHQEVRAEQGVVGWGGDVDEPGHGSRGMCLCAPLAFLPPLKGQAEA
jgi:hypothetical protein